MVNADGRTALIFANEISGSEGIGRPAGISGKREPIVSTGRLSSATANELATTAIRKPGRRGDHRRSMMISASRSEEHTSELQSLMRISYAVFCLKKKTVKLYIDRSRTNKTITSITKEFQNPDKTYKNTNNTR